MSCRGCLESLLRLLNLLMMSSGLIIVAYGIYLLVEWSTAASAGDGGRAMSPAAENAEPLALGRPSMLVLSIVDEGILHVLSSAWFIYAFMGVGTVLFLISCIGRIGATTNRCCLSFYSSLLALMILVELGCAAFIFFDQRLKELILADKTGNFSHIYDFLKDNWQIAKWIVLGFFSLQVLQFLIALWVRAEGNRPAAYDSDEEYTAPRYHIIRQGTLVTGMPAVGTLGKRPCRNDAWSERMREKIASMGLIHLYSRTIHRFRTIGRKTVPPPEDKGCCCVM